jgi:hypothetical protein
LALVTTGGFVDNDVFQNRRGFRVNTKRVAIMKKRNVYGERCLRIKREDAI